MGAAKPRARVSRLTVPHTLSNQSHFAWIRFGSECSTGQFQRRFEKSSEYYSHGSELERTGVEIVQLSAFWLAAARYQHRAGCRTSRYRKVAHARSYLLGYAVRGKT